MKSHNFNSIYIVSNDLSQYKHIQWPESIQGGIWSIQQPEIKYKYHLFQISAQKKSNYIDQHVIYSSGSTDAIVKRLEQVFRARLSGNEAMKTITQHSNCVAFEYNQQNL